MTGSVESVSNSPGGNVLVVAPNWLGDGIMAMPALQLLRKRLPEGASIDLLARSGQARLWDMHADIRDVLHLPSTRLERRRLIADLRSSSYAQAILLPNSFRSAVLPFRSGIPLRRGTAVQLGRGLLVNDPVDLSDLEAWHQQWEMARLLLGEPLPDSLPPPRLTAPEDACTRVREWLTPYASPLLGLIPGAARGPSKQWPAERFQTVARKWHSQTGGGVCWLGTPEDQDLCDFCNQSLGDAGRVLAGKTSLPEFAAALSLLNAVVANDSGGMHLAAALQVPTVAVFGITDPEKTGPLSPHTTVIQHSSVRNRRVPRESPEAEAALASVTAEEVVEAVLAFQSRPVKGS